MFSHSTQGTGKVVWRTHVRQTSGGPNGLALGDGRIYGNSAKGAFALDEATGKVIWRRLLVHGANQAVDIAPQFANGLVYTSTVGLLPGGTGVLYALDAATGRVRWHFNTVLHPWAVPGQGGWRRSVVDAVSRSGRHGVLRRCEPRPMGRHGGTAERRGLSRPRPVHGLAPRAERR